MTPRYGIDTSILLRLVTGEPAAEFEKCVECLECLIEGEDAEVLASNQVIGEAYIALQHHYKVSKAEARRGLRSVLESGLVSPLNGANVLSLLEVQSGAGLLDRLIVDDYASSDASTLTLDRRMARLEGCKLLSR